MSISGKMKGTGEWIMAIKAVQNRQKSIAADHNAGSRTPEGEISCPLAELLPRKAERPTLTRARIR